MRRSFSYTLLRNSASVILRLWRRAVAVAFFGGLIGFKSRIPAGTLVVPMALAIGCKSIGMPLFPPLVIFATYAALGMRIGSQFDQDILSRAKHLLVPLIGTSIFLALGSAGIGMAFARYISLDATSAYLASTPGGLDSVAVVAGELKADSVLYVSAFCTAAHGHFDGTLFSAAFIKNG